MTLLSDICQVIDESSLWSSPVGDVPQQLSAWGDSDFISVEDKYLVEVSEDKWRASIRPDLYRVPSMQYWRFSYASTMIEDRDSSCSPTSVEMGTAGQFSQWLSFIQNFPSSASAELLSQCKTVLEYQGMTKILSVSGIVVPTGTMKLELSSAYGPVLFGHNFQRTIPSSNEGVNQISLPEFRLYAPDNAQGKLLENQWIDDDGSLIAYVPDPYSNTSIASTVSKAVSMKYLNGGEVPWTEQYPDVKPLHEEGFEFIKPFYPEVDHSIFNRFTEV